MTKVQILENEQFIENADFENCEVWLLTRSTENELDERIINIPEITESLLDSASKFPKLLTAIYEAHPLEYEFDEEGNIINATMTFDYEVITDNREHFAIHCYVCDVNKFKD